MDEDQEDPALANIELGYYDGPTETLIDAIAAADIRSATMDLMCTPVEDDTLDGLAERPRRRFRLGPIEVTDGTYRMQVNAASLSRLRDHADRGEVVVDSIYIRDTAGELVSAHDVGNGWVAVSERVPRDSLARFRTVLGDDLRPLED